ncbi:MAG: spore germination protein, partial [Clostridia bacterium]|nr:spore germination protein [Clostridia bacterium]
MTKQKQASVELKVLQEKLKDCPDIVQRKVLIDGKTEAYFINISTMVNKDLLQRDFIRPILSMTLEQLSDSKKVGNLPCGDTTLLYTTQEVLTKILMGATAFVCDKLEYAIICSTTDIEQRSIDEPETEKNIRGPHEGFVEVLDTNLSILRRKIHNSSLKFKEVTLGDISHQKVVVVYIEGIANQELLDGLYNKISAIKIDALPAIGYIEQAITSHPNSIFPQFLATERPDKITASLLEGRIAILQEGTPVAMIAPVTFISFFQALDDYSTLWLHGTFLRLIRIFGAIFIAVFLPSLYVAITSFHYYAVPLTLLVTLAESRSKVPLSLIHI